MFQFITRLTAIVLAAIALLIVATMFAAKLLMPFPAIQIMYTGSLNAPNSTVYDIYTSVQYSYAYPNNNVSPDGTMTYQKEWIDSKLHIRVSNSSGQNTRLLGIYDEFTSFAALAWAADSQSIYITDNPIEGNIEIYQIDVSTGDASLWGTYDFGGRVDIMYLFAEDKLILMRERQFAVLNTATREMTPIFESNMSPYILSDKYIVYGTAAQNQASTSAVSAVVNILNLETMQVDTLTEERVGTRIYNVAYWSPTHPLLPLILQDSQIVLYDAATHSLTPLPEQYRIGGASSLAWSSDGERIVLRDTESELLVIYNIETGEETPLLSQADSVSPSYNAQWTPDDQFILITPDIIMREIAYQIYDANTGMLLRDLDQPQFERPESYFITWQRPFR